MERAIFLLTVQKETEEYLALAQSLGDKLAQKGMLSCRTPEGIEITIPGMALLEVKINKSEQEEEGRGLEMKIEWIDEGSPL